MHQIMTALDAIQFGPFTTAYHKQLVTDAFRVSARQFVTTSILPQVDHDIVEFDGTLTPRATEDRNCGANSAIKNCFYLDVRFFGDAKTDYSELKTQLWYRPAQSAFQVASGSSIYVWTPTRRAERVSQKAAIQSMVDSVLSNDRKTPFCPVCFSNVPVVNTPDIFHAVCSNGCFQYNFHKDEQGHLLHGHFNMREPVQDA